VPAPENLSRGAQVGDPAVGAAADDRLLNVDAVEGSYLMHVGRQMRKGHGRSQGREVDLELSFVFGVRVGVQRGKFPLCFGGAPARNDGQEKNPWEL